MDVDVVASLTVVAFVGFAAGYFSGRRSGKRVGIKTLRGPWP